MLLLNEGWQFLPEPFMSNLLKDRFSTFWKNGQTQAVRILGPAQKGIMISQSFTFIDPGGNQADYVVYDADRHNEYHWSTEHGDRGFDGSFAKAQDQARTALKSSMAVRRRSNHRY